MAGLNSGWRVVVANNLSRNAIGRLHPFRLYDLASESIHTTFTYRNATDTWEWLIDDEAKGKTDRFANVELSRKE
ncbi:MAG TPA: hypothetical protein VGI45_17945 [Terracidiphilus sp.]